MADASLYDNRGVVYKVILKQFFYNSQFSPKHIQPVPNDIIRIVTSIFATEHMSHYGKATVRPLGACEWTAIDTSKYIVILVHNVVIDPPPPPPPPLNEPLIGVVG